MEGCAGAAAGRTEFTLEKSIVLLELSHALTTNALLSTGWCENSILAVH